MNTPLSGPELVKLKQRVVDNFSSSNWRELGALVDMMDEVERHPRLLRSLGFGDEDYEGLALTFLRRMVASFIVFATTDLRPQPLIYSMPAFFEQAVQDNPCCPGRFLSSFLVESRLN